MHIRLLTLVGALALAPPAFAQDAAAAGVDGSAPGKILLVLRNLPPGKPAMIVREPPYLNVRQRSILFFSPKGTAEDLAIALTAFDRIRREDGEVITQPRTVDNIGRPASKVGVVKSSGDPAKDSAAKVHTDLYLRAMQSLVELVHAQPAKDLRGLGMVQWIQLDRPPIPSSP